MHYHHRRKGVSRERLLSSRALNLKFQFDTATSHIIIITGLEYRFQSIRFTEPGVDTPKPNPKGL